MARGCLGTIALVTTIAAQAQGQEQAILIDRPSISERWLDLAPQAGAYESFFANSYLPVSDALENSGGFDRSDPQRLSIYGNSPAWTHWALNGLNIDDPIFPGAAAVRIPYHFLGQTQLRFDEDPGNETSGGFVLIPRAQADGPARSFGSSLTFPEAGGIFPLGIPITHFFSATHAEERIPRPPNSRPRFGEEHDFWLMDTMELGTGHLRYALDIDQGTRRFLNFSPQDGQVRSILHDPFVLADGILQFVPLNATYQMYVVGEYRQRAHLFAEVAYPEQETVSDQSATLFSGVTSPDFSSSLLLQWSRVARAHPDFTRELMDPAGMGLAPVHRDETNLVAKLDLHYRWDPWYIGVNQSLILSTPIEQHWVEQINLAGASYSQVDWSAGNSLETLGQIRLGLHQRRAMTPWVLSYDLYGTLDQAENGTRTNTLLFPNLGGKVEFEHDLGNASRVFILLARIPLAIDTPLSRLLDPAYMQTGGQALSLANHLAPASIETGAMGMELQLSEEIWVSLQIMGKLYRHTYWIGPADPENTNSHRYVLSNYPSNLSHPFYVSINAQIARIERAHWQGSLAFTAETAVAYSAFGNGPVANDLAALSYTTANPDSLVNGLSNLNTDRAFMTKALLGWTPIPDLWIVATVAHRDGQPFAFFNFTTSQGQLHITYDRHRGSPLSQKLIGARTDFRVNTDAKIQYTFKMQPYSIKVWIAAANIFDFGNEVMELSTPVGRVSRAALELEVPRSLSLGAELIY